MKNTGQDIRSFASQMHDQQLRDEPRGGYTIVLDPVQQAANGAAVPPPAQSDQDVPPKIYEMIRMYEYGNNSFELKCRNFYRQGKFMEDYEDDAPWEGVFSRYFPTYHDLNIRQLRGYFTWRTQVRKGIYRPISTSLAYIYLYELLNGIGTSSVEESLWKMQEFETEYLDSEIGDERMRHNLRRWMLELAVIHQLPKNTVNQYANPFTLEQDRRLEILRDPSNRTDEEVFRVLCWFADRNLEASPVYVANADSATHLFAGVWRRASEQFRHNGNDFFTACFGPLKAYHWYPLGNAVYLERRTLPESAYELTGCRRYVFHDGCWKEEKHDELYFDRKRVKALIHVTDLMLRRYLKTGRYLRENAEEAWAIPYVEAVIEADRQAKIEAARPKVHIHLENLAQIRKDAVATRDSLLTEEELAESNVEPTTAEMPVAEAVGVSNDDNNINIDNDIDNDYNNDIDNDYNNDIDNDYNCNKDNDNATVKLEPLHRQILLSLLGGGTADGLLRTHRLMPAVVADSINEAFFDEIGDSILDCDGDRLSLVEDYVEDVRLLLTH